MASGSLRRKSKKELREIELHAEPRAALMIPK
jgi:hypothetical protein